MILKLFVGWLWAWRTKTAKVTDPAASQSREIKAAIDTALSREEIWFDDPFEAANALVNAYHAYKNAYTESCQRIAELTIELGVAPPPEVDDGQDVAIPGDRPIYRPEYRFDGLWTDPKVIHNHDFMCDPRYVAAFTAGQQALVHKHNMYWRLHVALYFAAPHWRVISSNAAFGGGSYLRRSPPISIGATRKKYFICSTRSKGWSRRNLPPRNTKRLITTILTTVIHSPWFGRLSPLTPMSGW